MKSLWLLTVCIALIPLGFLRGADFQETLKKAENGDAPAQAMMGQIYGYGIGVAKDPKEALKWYRKAADQGMPVAQHMLGFMYANGEGVEKDSIEAVKWFRRAADQGMPLAQSIMGLMYYRGEGVAKNPVEALAWYYLAQSNGENTQKDIAILERENGSQGTHLAQQRAKALKVKLEKPIPQQSKPDLSVLYARCYGSKQKQISKEDVNQINMSNRAIKEWNQATTPIVKDFLNSEIEPTFFALRHEDNVKNLNKILSKMTVSSLLIEDKEVATFYSKSTQIHKELALCYQKLINAEMEENESKSMEIFELITQLGKSKAEHGAPVMRVLLKEFGPNYQKTLEKMHADILDHLAN